MSWYNDFLHSEDVRRLLVDMEATSSEIQQSRSFPDQKMKLRFVDSTDWLSSEYRNRDRIENIVRIALPGLSRAFREKTIVLHDQSFIPPERLLDEYHTVTLVTPLKAFFLRSYNRLLVRLDQTHFAWLHTTELDYENVGSIDDLIYVRADYDLGAGIRKNQLELALGNSEIQLGWFKVFPATMKLFHALRIELNDCPVAYAQIENNEQLGELCHVLSTYLLRRMFERLFGVSLRWIAPRHLFALDLDVSLKPAQLQRFRRFTSSMTAQTLFWFYQDYL